MTTPATARIPRFRVGVLGVITITAYGSWYYAFGVLLDPILADTGWREPVLTSAFGLSAFIAGFGSLAGGWLLDRLGSRVVFGLAAVGGATAFTIAAYTGSAVVFASAAAIGGGIFASLAFYHVTQTAAVRISPGAENRAIAVLTIWGAFASAIFIPLAAWLLTLMDWRRTLLLLTYSGVLALAAGSVTISTEKGGSSSKGLVLSDMRTGLRDARAKRFLFSQGLAGIGVATILVYQVPAMTAAGLALGVASFWAGFRGFAQLGGRLPLMPIVARIGVANSLRLAYLSVGVGAVALAFASSPWLAAVYALLVGFGVGALSPLVGMYTKEVFGESSLGTAMGFVGFVFLVVGSVGPVAAGWVADATASRAIPVLGCAVIALIAGALIRSES